MGRRGALGEEVTFCQISNQKIYNLVRSSQYIQYILLSIFYLLYAKKTYIDL